MRIILASFLLLAFPVVLIEAPKVQEVLQCFTSWTLSMFQGKKATDSVAAAEILRARENEVPFYPYPFIGDIRICQNTDEVYPGSANKKDLLQKPPRERPEGWKRNMANPPEYTDPANAINKPWSDPYERVPAEQASVRKIKFNQIDKIGNKSLDRRSFYIAYFYKFDERVMEFEAVQGLQNINRPLFPIKGADLAKMKLESAGVPLTSNGLVNLGLIGRGTLGRIGVNQTADAIFSRFNEKGELQFLAIQRRNGKWAMPGGFLDAKNPLEHAWEAAKRELTEEGLIGLKGPNPLAKFEEKVKNKETFYVNLKAKLEKIKHLFNCPRLIYRGIVPDNRNTKNSWIETSAYNFEDKDGLTLKDASKNWEGIDALFGDDAVGARWMKLDELVLERHVEENAALKKEVDEQRKFVVWGTHCHIIRQFGLYQKQQRPTATIPQMEC